VKSMLHFKKGETQLSGAPANFRRQPSNPSHE
jgi:hypothetical protein